MEYKCKENDVIIELGIDKDELYISAGGERVKTVIGLSDLKQALILFDVDNKKRMICECEKSKPNYPEMVWCDNCGKYLNAAS